MFLFYLQLIYHAIRTAYPAQTKPKLKLSLVSVIVSAQGRSPVN